MSLPLEFQTMTEHTDEIDISHIRLVAPLDDMLRLKPFIGVEEKRYYLNGIRFEQGVDGVLLVATDGHRLGAFNSTDALCQGDGIARLPTRLPKIDRKKRAWLVVGQFAGAELALIMSFSSVTATARQIAENASLARADAIYPDALIEGEFPDWRRLLPNELGKPMASFNSAYLADFAAAANRKKGVPIKFYGGSENDPHIVQVGSEKNFIGIQMPMRTDAISKIPAWIAAPKPVRSRSKKEAA